jgi:oxygen-independent coproporphyrinogen-3 oxidase
MDKITPERRNIHTYPFKYKYEAPEKFFAPEKAAIYVHIPFCRRKCHFCDYTVCIGSDYELRNNYVDAVCEEIRGFHKTACFPKFIIDALYIGGGTPGLLDSDQIVRILTACRDLYDFTDDAELAIEFDPKSVNYKKLKTLFDAGFNRVSLGVQCFDDEVLKENNRPHSVSEVYTAFDEIQRAGFTHTNIDILYPMFGQSMKQWGESVVKAIDMQPATITAYPLEIWPNTGYDHWLKKGECLPGWDAEQRMTRHAYDSLEAAGYRRESTGGYFHSDRTRRYCRFGDYYWQTWPMLGFGVSAKSVVHNRLYSNIQNIHEYIQRINNNRSAMDFCTYMTREQEMRRVMIRGLKQCVVHKKTFCERFGVSMATVFGEEIQTLVESDWLLDLEDRIELTREGQVHDRSVYAVFYTEDDLRSPREGEVQYGLSDPLPD